MRVTRLSMLALSLVLLAAGCTSSTAGGAGTLKVVVAFYPLQYVVEQVGGDQVSVTSLTHPGVEPHDLELTAKQVASVAFADLLDDVLQGVEGHDDVKPPRAGARGRRGAAGGQHEQCHGHSRQSNRLHEN